MAGEELAGPMVATILVRRKYKYLCFKPRSKVPASRDAFVPVVKVFPHILC